MQGAHDNFAGMITSCPACHTDNGCLICCRCCRCRPTFQLVDIQSEVYVCTTAHQLMIISGQQISLVKLTVSTAGLSTSPHFPTTCKQPKSRHRQILKPAASNAAVFDGDQTSPDSELVSKPRRLQPQNHPAKPHQHQANQHLPQRPPNLLERSAASQQAYKQRKQAVKATHATSTAAQQARSLHIQHQNGSAFSTSVSGKASWQRQHQKGPAINRDAAHKAGGLQHQKSNPVNKTALEATTDSRYQQYQKGIRPTTDTAPKATDQHRQHQNRHSDAASEASAYIGEGGDMPHPGIINRCIVDAASANAVLRVYADLKKGFNVINLATAFHRLAKVHCATLHDITSPCFIAAQQLFRVMLVHLGVIITCVWSTMHGTATPCFVDAQKLFTVIFGTLTVIDTCAWSCDTSFSMTTAAAYT